jgi:DNA polymerase-1
MKPGDTLYLIDGSAYIFRAYHALPPLTRASDGLPVGAVSGFCNMLWKLLKDTGGDLRPTHMAVVFDAGAKTFRNEIYPAYKANRPPAPEDLIPQFPLTRDATRAFHVSAVELDGFEADDLIATYAKVASDAGAEVVIVSSDKDLMQLINDRVVMMDPVKGVVLGREAVLEKFGVAPDRVVDVQALAGDSVDNVPGAPGIGIKTAAQLIGDFGDLDTLLARAAEVKQDKRRETLIGYADQIRISRDLVKLKDDVPLPMPLDEMRVRDIDPAVLGVFLNLMEFKGLARRFAAPVPAGTATPVAVASSTAPVAVSTAIDRTAYDCVTTLDQLHHWVMAATRAGVIAVDTETDALSSSAAGLVGVSLAIAPGQACYIPLAHIGEGGLDLMGGAPDQVSLDAALRVLKPLLENPDVLKIGQNIKYDLSVFERYGIRVAPIDDTMLMSYVLAAGQHGHGMDELSVRHLDHTPIAFKEIAGTGKAQISFDRVPLDRATQYAAEDADVTLRLHALLKPQLREQGLLTVYETLERPLPQVLSDMELAGIKVDVAELNRLSMEFDTRMRGYEAEAVALAGRPFNLASPKQIGEILYDEMKLPGGVRTANGSWATGADTLEELAGSGVALARSILEYRGVAKLKSTYTDALVAAINPKTGRVHTSYSMASTTTGRLASSDPNLQNIPIRTEDGRKIRAAFVAEPGHVLISADYSQIELRLLAHIADIGPLKQAFSDGVDIHALTASQVFNVPIEGMDPMVRRAAKAINFGIIYGMSAFGLANQLGVPNDEAGRYIKAYFERFPGIRAYMDATKAEAKQTGAVHTIFGRRISIPAIHSKSQAERAFGERAAINAPIQGAAADVIRRAMVRMPGALHDAGLKARMLLQVHDELVFEAPASEADATCTVVRNVMEGAALPALALTVPLTVEAKAGLSWGEAH